MDPSPLTRFRASIPRNIQGCTNRFTNAGNGAGSIATVAAERPRPARICASRPPKEWPMIAGFLFNPRMTGEQDYSIPVTL